MIWQHPNLCNVLTLSDKEFELSYQERKNINTKKHYLSRVSPFSQRISPLKWKMFTEKSFVCLFVIVVIIQTCKLISSDRLTHCFSCWLQGQRVFMGTPWRPEPKYFNKFRKLSGKIVIWHGHCYCD